MSLNWRALGQDLFDCVRHPLYMALLTIGAAAGAALLLVSVFAFILALIGAVLVPLMALYAYRTFFAKRGWVYEILSLDETWEIHDAAGARVTLRKMIDVQFLRDRVTTIGDPAWGAGNLFAEYHCTPGRFVGTGQSGERQYAAIVLDPPRRRGDIEHFEITRVIAGGFTARDEWIEVDSETCTGPLRVSVVFPRDRLPQNCQWTRRTGNREKNLSHIGQRWLEGGSQECYVRVARPSPDDVYRVTWTW